MGKGADWASKQALRFQREREREEGQREGEREREGEGGAQSLPAASAGPVVRGVSHPTCKT